MQNLDPTQYGEADAGGRRRAERLLVSETLPLRKIICRVIFYEALCKADASARARAVDSPPEAAIRSNFRFAHCEHGSGFVICYSVDDPEPGKQTCRRRSSI
jgi:hypothetical protein